MYCLGFAARKFRTSSCFNASSSPIGDRFGGTGISKTSFRYSKCSASSQGSRTCWNSPRSGNSFANMNGYGLIHGCNWSDFDLNSRERDWSIDRKFYKRSIICSFLEDVTFLRHFSVWKVA